MSKSSDVVITRPEFVNLIYGQIGEQFADMLKYHEGDDDRSPFINLEEQNAICIFMGIDITCLSESRRELTESIIGLLYDVFTEDLEETRGRNSDLVTMPDRINRFYGLTDIITCPVEAEAILSRCLYLLGHYDDPYQYATDTRTLMAHMLELGIFPSYKDRNGQYISRAVSETLHLPDGQSEMMEALTKGIPEGCRDGSRFIPYDQMPDEAVRYRFAYPDIAQIISRMYAFRNESVHRANWKDKPMASKFQAVNDMILTAMMIIAKNFRPLTLAIYRRNDDAVIGAAEYCQSIVNAYRDSAENKLCCDFNWKLYDGSPDYVRNLNIIKRGNMKKISLSLWSLGQGRANLLQGVAGCGKTWAMRRLLYFYANNYLGLTGKTDPGNEKEMFCPLIPVYIPMISWYQELRDTDSIIDVITRIIINNTAFDEEMRKKIPSGVRQLLEKGRFLIIFDGVDECPYEEKGRIYRTIDSFVNSFAGGKPTNLCMISDREISVENQAGMISYVADSIKDSDMNEYVKRYLRYTRPELIDEEGHFSPIEKDRFLLKLKELKPASEIRTVFELVKLTEICANDEVYAKFLQDDAEKRRYTLDIRYLMLLLDRESKEKLSAEGGSPEKHMDSLRSILSHLSEKFDEEDISRIDKDTLDNAIMSVSGADKQLAQTYRKHLVQEGILSEIQDMMDLKLYYSFASRDIQDAAGLI